MTESTANISDAVHSLRKAYEFEEAGNRKQISITLLSRLYGNIIATGTSDGIVELFSIGNSHPLVHLSNIVSDSVVISLAFDASEELLLVGHQSGHVVVWELESEQTIRIFKIEGLLKLVMSPLALVLAALRANGHLELWSLEHNEMINSYFIDPVKYSESPITEICFSPNGRHIALGATMASKCSIILINLESGEISQQKNLSTKKTLITRISFSNEHPIIAIGTQSGEVQAFNFESFTSLGLPASSTNQSEIVDILFINDSSAIVALSSVGVSIWKVDIAKSSAFVRHVQNPSGASIKQLSQAYGHYLIAHSFELSSSAAVWFYNLHQVGLCLEANMFSSHFEASSSAPDISNSNQTVTMDDNELFQAISTDIKSNKFIYTLRNRLDHLKGLRVTWSGKSAPSVISALSKQASGVKPELMAELIASKIIDAALNTTPEEPNSLSRLEDISIFLNLVKQCLKFMTDSQQLNTLTYVSQLFAEVGSSCADKFAVLKDELSRVAETDVSAAVIEKCKLLLTIL